MPLYEINNNELKPLVGTSFQDQKLWEKLPEEMTDTEKRYSKYLFNKDPELIYSGKGYYVARNWGVNNVQRFIDKFSERFPKIDFSIAKG